MGREIVEDREGRTRSWRTVLDLGARGVIRREASQSLHVKKGFDNRGLE